MQTDVQSPREAARRRRLLRMSQVAAAAVAVAIVVAGCGGGSKSSSSSSSSSSTPTTTTSSGSQPLTKQQYEAKLGPVLNNQVVPALRAALANGGAANPAKVDQAISSLKLAHDSMASVTPPTEIADLHNQAVQTLQSMIDDATKLRDAEKSGDSSGTQAAANSLKADAQKIQSVGSQLTARGY